MPTYLAELSRTLPLSPLWADYDVLEDEVPLGDVRVMRAGIMARRVDGVEVTGSAATHGGSPIHRAWLELLERTAIVDAGDMDLGINGERRSARSNGVAVGVTWEDACERAALELAERDRVLRAWWGQIDLRLTTPPTLVTLIRTHEWQACLLRGPAWMRDAVVAVVIGFPGDHDLPLARGFSARRDEGEALIAAGNEALQNLAFLWNEGRVVSPPQPAPTPIFHLDYYLYPPHQRRLRRWLGGAHRGRTQSTEVDSYRPLAFADLTPQHLRGRVCVARAVCAAAAPLEFGVGPPHLPPDLLVHPIP